MTATKVIVALEGLRDEGIPQELVWCGIVWSGQPSEKPKTTLRVVVDLGDTAEAAFTSLHSEVEEWLSGHPGERTLLTTSSSKKAAEGASDSNWVTQGVVSHVEGCGEHWDTTQTLWEAVKEAFPDKTKGVEDPTLNSICEVLGKPTPKPGTVGACKASTDVVVQICKEGKDPFARPGGQEQPPSPDASASEAPTPPSPSIPASPTPTPAASEGDGQAPAAGKPKTPKGVPQPAGQTSAMPLDSDTARCVRLRGLPFKATVKEIEEFVQKYGKGLKVKPNGINILFNGHGQSKGEAWVEFETPEDAESARHELNEKYIGTRYIEVFQSTEVDMILRQKVRERYQAKTDGEGAIFIKLRGLPFEATSEELCEFLKPLEVKTEDVHLVQLHSGKRTGEAFIRMNSEEETLQAMQKHKQHLGNRYVEVFRSSEKEMTTVRENMANCSNFSGDDDRQGISRHVVRARGLPFNCNEADVANFFHGLNMCNEGIHLVFTHEGRPTGEAYIEFKYAADVKAALLRKNNTLGHRWIEVFEASEEEVYRAFGVPDASAYQSMGAPNEMAELAATQAVPRPGGPGTNYGHGGRGAGMGGRGGGRGGGAPFMPYPAPGQGFPGQYGEMVDYVDFTPPQ